MHARMTLTYARDVSAAAGCGTCCYDDLPFFRHRKLLLLHPDVLQLMQALALPITADPFTPAAKLIPQICILDG